MIRGIDLVKNKQLISTSDVSHLAELARIDLDQKDIVLLQFQLNEMLDYFEMINEVDTEGVPPTYHVFDLTNVLRDDDPETPSPEKLLRNVPNMKDRYIKAPKMV